VLRLAALFTKLVDDLTFGATAIDRPPDSVYSSYVSRHT